MSMLTVNKTKTDSRLTAEIIGRVDVMTAPQFENDVSSGLDGIFELVLDMKQLDYMSSAGLRVIVVLQKAMSAKKGKLTVCCPPDNIMDILTATGLADYLDIER